MHTTIRKSAVTVAALGALGLGVGAVAGAADDRDSSGSGTAQTRPAREQLSSEVAAKVKAAALEKVPGATVLRTEAGGPYGTPYHAHITKADGTSAVVLVDDEFNATTVQAERGRRGRHRPDGRRGGFGETPLTGEVKQKVEAAVLAELPGATIIRTETNAGGTAPYESHVRKSDGTEVEVLVSKSYEVVEVREGPAHP